MSHICHHAIVVTGTHEWTHMPTLPNIFAARDAAIEAGCTQVTEVVGPGINNTSSFLVAPDGSKEGWPDSDAGDLARDRFIAWLSASERAGYFNWAEVVLGKDDVAAYVERHAWDEERTS